LIRLVKPKLRVLTFSIFYQNLIKKLENFSYFYFYKRVPYSGQSVLITGCDSGFGFILAKDLKSLGCDVIGKV